MVRMVSHRAQKAFMLNKPFCGSAHARWVVTNPTDSDKSAMLQVLEHDSRAPVTTGPKVTIPPGQSRELALDWGRLSVAGDFVVRVVDDTGLTVFDERGRLAEKSVRLFLVT